jgi:hypothetical protein
VHLAEQRSIGEKRNYGCEHAIGEMVCHWDDDDWSDPRRLTDQVTKLQVFTECAVTGYHSMRFTDGAKWWKYEGTSNYALGTSLCYWRSWWKEHPFEPKNIGEDNTFVAVASAAKQLISDDADFGTEKMMHATIHPLNTSPRMLGDNWKLL